MNKIDSLKNWVLTPNNDEKDINTKIKRFKMQYLTLISIARWNL